MSGDELSAPVDDLTARTAVVTGASRGIGAAIARALGAAGANVVLCGRDAKALEAAAAQLPGPAAWRTADVTRAEDLTALREFAESRFGAVDLLVANAGTGGPPTPLGRLEPEVWRQGLEVNLTGVFLTLREFLPGVIALTEYAAAEAAPSGVRVNCLAPGTVLTETIAGLPENVRSSLAAEHAGGRLGTLEDVAASALFLLGDRSGWITGHTLDLGARVL